MESDAESCLGVEVCTWHGTVAQFNDGWLFRASAVEGRVVGVSSISFVHANAVFEDLMPYLRVRTDSSILIALSDAWNCPMMVEAHSREALEVVDLDAGPFRPGAFIDYIHFGRDLKIELVSRAGSRPLFKRIETKQFEQLEIDVRVIAKMD
jgi:hypothetical protein